MNQGFFTRKNPQVSDQLTRPITRTTKPASKIFAGQSGPDCTRCKLYKGVQSPRMKPFGNGEKGVLIIGQAPGHNEDKEGIPFSPNGDSGRMLKIFLEGHGIDIDRDCWRINCVNCRTTKEDGSNRPPTDAEIMFCKPLVEKYIRELKPKAIWLFGTEAIKSMYSDRFEKVNSTLLRGMSIPHNEYKAWVTCLNHPQFILRKENDEHLWMIFQRDVEQALKSLEYPEPVIDDYNKRVTVLWNYNDTMDVLRHVNTYKPATVVDFETRSLKPFVPYTEIMSTSLCFQEDMAYSFPLYMPHWNMGEFSSIKEELKKLLADPLVSLIAQNLFFETTWSREKLLTEPTSWLWDTMIVSHLLDSRKYITSLKTQVGIRWGIEDYGREIKPYMENTGPNGLNLLNKFPPDKLLHYGGLDALFEYWLYLEQYEEMSKPENSRLMDSYFGIFHPGTQVLSRMHSRGMPINERYYQTEHEKLVEAINDLERAIMDSEESVLFEQTTGVPLKQPDQKDFSAQNLCKLFFEIMGMPSIKQTSKGNESADAEVLEKLDLPFAKNIVLYRRLNKNRGYVEQFLRETFKGRLNPFFWLHKARSMRSSSSDINFQNIPTRDAESKKLTRSGVITDEGAHIEEVDYGSLEVRIIACRSECPTLVSYILDPSTDMHRDEAMELFLLDEAEVAKMIRFYAKNGWVFPQFYTSYYKSCANTLWPVVPTLTTTSGINLKEHLRSKGITTYSHFEAHLKKCEAKFWDRFRAVKEWQDRACADYLAKGYVEMAFGHRRHEYLDRGKVINSNIQGPGFHCLLRSLTVIDEVAMDEGWRSYQFGQIHDSGLMMKYPNEWGRVSQIQKWAMTENIREEQPWIIVPLEIERACCPMNASWFDQQEVDDDGIITKGNWKGLSIVGQDTDALNLQLTA